MYFLFHVLFFSQGFHLLIIEQYSASYSEGFADGFFCLVQRNAIVSLRFSTFDEVITELGLHRTDDLADLAVESLHPQTLLPFGLCKLPTSPPSGRRGRWNIPEQLLEGFGAVLDLFQDLLAFVLAVGEDVVLAAISPLVN